MVDDLFRNKKGNIAALSLRGVKPHSAGQILLTHTVSSGKVTTHCYYQNGAETGPGDAGGETHTRCTFEQLPPTSLL